jgi:hypothetical protein
VLANPAVKQPGTAAVIAIPVVTAKQPGIAK